VVDVEPPPTVVVDRGPALAAGFAEVDVVDGCISLVDGTEGAGAAVEGMAVVLGAPVVDGTIVVVAAMVLVVVVVVATVFFGIEPTALPGWFGPPATAPSRSAPII
jgi:hypothetical protein